VKALPERHHTVTKRQQNALFTRARRRGVLRTSAVGGSRSFVPRGFYEAHPHQPRLRWCLGPFRIWSPHGRVVKCREARRPTITPLPGPSGFFVPNRRPREDGPEYAWTAPRPSETMRALGGPVELGGGAGPACCTAPSRRPWPAIGSVPPRVEEAGGRAPRPPVPLHARIQSHVPSRPNPPFGLGKDHPFGVCGRGLLGTTIGTGSSRAPPQPPPRDGGSAFLLASLRSNSPPGISA
jgi:hypothetical protein